MTNTFEKYSKNIPFFIHKILDTHPDYIVPVERKGCKLLRWLKMDDIFDLIRYKQFFENTRIDLNGIKIAVIDDASKYTSTLLSYREYFESRGAQVDTYSFVGQIQLKTGERFKYDNKAKVFQYLEESTYQEYIIQQSNMLSRNDASFDIDHIIIETKITNKDFEEFLININSLSEYDYTNDIYTPNYIEKICLYNFLFPIYMPLCLQKIPFCILKKIRLSYNKRTEVLSIVPLIFPNWNTQNEINLDCIPFDLLFNQENASTDGKFMNLIFASSIYLLKSFFIAIGESLNLEKIHMNNYDISAYVGLESSKAIIESTTEFLKNSHFLNNCKSIKFSNTVIKSSNPSFPSVMSIMNELRGEYERRLQTKPDSVKNTNYFLSYDEIFSRYSGVANLMKWIDILCDRGVLVARNVLSDDKTYRRMCRSGEGDPDHTERKTGVLIPILINESGYKSRNDCYRVSSTFLNKLLANLSFDYPKSQYDFHDLFTKPYYYGPFTYCMNPLNNEVEIPLYRIESISRYCNYDDSKKEFVSINVNYPQLSNEIDNLFSQTDSVPYTEILTYIHFLIDVKEYFGTIDALNELIICRDEDIYYRHVHYDIIAALNDIKIAINTTGIRRKEKLERDASKIIKSAIKKLKYKQMDFFNIISDIFDSKNIYRETLKKINSSIVPFSEDFLNTKRKLCAIAYAELSLNNLLLYHLTTDRKYLNKAFSFINEDVKAFVYKDIEKFTSFIKVKKIKDSKDNKSYNKSFNENYDDIEKVVRKKYELLNESILKLPKPKETDYVRINKKRTREIAINKCEQYIRTKTIKEFTLLFFDFSGFRNVENSPSIDVIKQTRQLIESIVDNKNARLVYGLQGLESRGMIILQNINTAIVVSDIIKISLKTILSNQIPYKFGCSYAQIDESNFKLYSLIEKVWADAQECCEYNYQYHYHIFTISEGTFNSLNDEDKGDFKMIEKQTSEKYYYNTKLEEFDNKIVVKEEQTDPHIKIGIITALNEEFVAMEQMLEDSYKEVFPENQTKKSNGRSFTVGKIKSFDGHYHEVVLTQTLGPGNLSAQAKAVDLIERFPNLRIIIMTGIAGGIPNPNNIDKHVRLGDIVVSTGVISYDFVSDKGKIQELRQPSVPVTSRLIEAQQALDTAAITGSRPWEKYICNIPKSLSDDFSKPSEEFDCLFDYNGEKVNHPFDKNRTEFPKVFKGKIASANRVLKNPQKRDELRDAYDVYAVEMEASGISNASWEYEVGYYVIRGISDYCDGSKNDIWHNYAALCAAAYTRALLEKLPS